MEALFSGNNFQLVRLNVGTYREVRPVALPDNCE
jgi:hypothetical protein